MRTNWFLNGQVAQKSTCSYNVRFRREKEGKSSKSVKNPKVVESNYVTLQMCLRMLTAISFLASGRVILFQLGNHLTVRRLTFRKVSISAGVGRS